MSTLIEIEKATERLPTEDRQRLMVWLAQQLRQEVDKLPEPRRFMASTLRNWIKEDENESQSPQSK